MPAGHFDKLVQIQADVGTRDPMGQITPDWHTVGKRWAVIEDRSGRELVQAQQVNADVSAVITLREQYHGLTSQHRIKYGDRIFNIHAVNGSSDRTTRRGQVVHVSESV